MSIRMACIASRSRCGASSGSPLCRPRWRLTFASPRKQVYRAQLAADVRAMGDRQWHVGHADAAPLRVEKRGYGG